MTELKTLKNLSKTTIMVPDLTKKQPCTEELIEEIHTPIAELRDAAREWIKELRNVHCNTSATIGGFEVVNILDETEEPLVIIAWIKHFFNIEEEP